MSQRLIVVGVAACMLGAAFVVFYSPTAAQTKRLHQKDESYNDHHFFRQTASYFQLSAKKFDTYADDAHGLCTSFIRMQDATVKLANSRTQALYVTVRANAISQCGQLYDRMTLMRDQNASLARLYYKADKDHDMSVSEKLIWFEKRLASREYAG